MPHALLKLAFVATSASSPTPRRTPPPHRRNPIPSHKRPTGLLARIRQGIERRLCWLLNAAAHALLKLTMKLARNGFLSRAEVGILFRWAGRLNLASIRLLRRGRW